MAVTIHRVLTRIEFAFGLLAVSLLAVSLAGCGSAEGGGDHPATAPVEGTVTLNGKPLAGATVTFIPDVQSRPGQGPGATVRAAGGRTDAEGHYTARTFEEGDGAVPGKYVVIVVKKENTQQEEISMKEYIARGGARNRQANAGPKLLVPAKYTKRATSPFHITVKESGNEPFDFKLTGETKS